MTLRWSVKESALKPETRARLLNALASQLTNDGELVVQSDEFRDQTRNKEACLTKLSKLLSAAMYIPKKRRPTKPKRSAKEKRIQGKKARSRLKALRGKTQGE
jgi:ribosome-associated protein